MSCSSLGLSLSASALCFIALSSCRSQSGSVADYEAIEALHARDARAAMEQDFVALKSLWTSDGVLIAPGGPPLRGPELFAHLEQASWEDPGHEVLAYAFDFEEVEVVGDYAFEWGVVRGTIRDPQTGYEETTAFQIMRVLHIEGGVWRVHRAMWNALDEGPPNGR